MGVCLFGFIICSLFTVVNGFLINGFCLPNFCVLRCPNGYVKVNGCPTCQCNQTEESDRITSTSMQSPYQTGGFSGPSSFPQMNSGSMSGPQINIPGSSYHNPCIPSQSYCPLQCAKYKTGANGCHYCLCDQGVQETTTLPTTKLSTIAPVKLDNPCITSETTCDKQCQYGFLIGPGNCQYCICSPYIQQIITEQPTTTTAMTSVLQNPCVPSQTCTLTCDYGFVHSTSGCQYCVCNPNNTKGIQTTAIPGIQTTNNPLSEQCTIAIAICQVKCRTGFMTDPNDCTFCKCKAEIESALRLPHTNDIDIKLMKPCLVEFDSCNIFCAHGYLRGPDNCQFCACAH